MCGRRSKRDRKSQSSGLASMCDPGPNVNTQIVVALGKLALAVTLARSYIARDCYGFASLLGLTPALQYGSGGVALALGVHRLSTAHCTIFLANHAPEVYHWNRYILATLCVTYFFVYWAWDTANSSQANARDPPCPIKLVI